MAILKDVSGDNFHEENHHRSDYNDCDKRLRHLDFETTGTNSESGSSLKMKKIRSTADVVTEAIQRFDTTTSSSATNNSVTASKSNNSGLNSANNKSDLSSSSGSSGSNKAAKCQNLVNQIRQRHSSTKKNRKSGTSKSSSSASSGYTPILPAPDIDLYLNQSASNVSPDSGIQSEGTVGLNNSSPPQILTTSVGTGTNTEIVSTQQQSFQFSPGSATAAAVYQWPQNGYYPGSISGTDWTMATNSGYILNNAGTALIVTSLQPPEVSPADVSTTILPPTATTALPNTVVPIPYIPEIKEHFRPSKRGRGRPKGSKNKKKKMVTMECGSQTVDSIFDSKNIFDSKMSSMSSSPCSVVEEEDEAPPPPMFMGGGINEPVSRSPLLKNPPRLEPQIEPPVKSNPQKEVIILESDDDDDDRSTIMFSDGEDPEDEPLPPPKLMELQKEQQTEPQPPVLEPPILDKPPDISNRVKKKKKKSKSRSDSKCRSDNEVAPPILSKSSRKKKSKKKSKVRERSKESMRASTPPILEPIEVQCEPASEFEEVSVKVSPVLSPKELSPVPKEDRDISEPPQDMSLTPLSSIEPAVKKSAVKCDSLIEEVVSTPVEDGASENTSSSVTEKDVKEPFSFCELKPMFGEKYRNLNIDKFWKKKKSKKMSSSTSAVSSTKLLAKQQEPLAPKVTTKAAVKEMANIPLMKTSTTPSTKTMLAVLKSLGVKSKPGRKKKGKTSSDNNSASSKKKDQPEPPSNFINSSDRDADSVSSKSPAFSPRSVASSTDDNSLKIKKGQNLTKQSLIEMGWRSKHKNVVDPVFLGSLEQLLQGVSSVQIDLEMSKDIWPDRPSTSVPSIFRRRKFILSAVSKTTAFEKKRGRPKRTEKAVKEAEHRLPLKKRHIHHQQSDNDEPSASNISIRRASGAEKKRSGGRSSRKSSTDADHKRYSGTFNKELRKNSSNASTPPRIESDKNIPSISNHSSKSKQDIKKAAAQAQPMPVPDKYLPPSSGQSPVKSLSIVDTIAACVDKYTGSGKAKKDFSQPLTVVTCDPKEKEPENARVKSLGSPRKRHLLKMQSQVELAPPTLEKVDNPTPQNSRCPKNLENIQDKSKEKADDEKRPSSPPKLSRYDEKPPADPPLLSPISDQSSPVIQRRKSQTMPLVSPISEDEQRPNIYRPRVSDISEDDVSDMDKAMSPKVIVPIKETTQTPRVSKVPVKDTTMSSRVSKVPIEVKRLQDTNLPPKISKIPIEVKRLQDRNVSPTPKVSKIPIEVKRLQDRNISPTPKISKVPIEVKRLKDGNISPTPKIPKVPSIDGVMSPRVSRPIKEKSMPPKTSKVAIKDTNKSSKVSKPINNEAMPPKLMLESKSRPLSVMMKNSNVMNCTVRVRKLPSPRPESPKPPPQIDIFDLLLNGKSTKKVELVKEKPKEIIKTSDETTSERITWEMEKDSKRIKSSEKITEDKETKKPKSSEKITDVTEKDTKKIKPSEKIIDDKKAKEVQLEKEKSREIAITSDQTSDKTKIKMELTKEVSASKDQPDPVKEPKKKKKRRANKTGFPTIKKKKKPVPKEETCEEMAKVSPSKRARKAKKTERNKKAHLPLRVSNRIIAEQKSQSDTDSRPESRLELTSSTTSSQKRQNPEDSNADSSIALEAGPPIKRSKLYEDVDENIDCLALLPTNDMEMEDEGITSSHEDVTPNSSKGSRKKKLGIHLEKKNYLIAGLFSNFYKEDHSKTPVTTPHVPINKVVYNPEEHIHGLLPPPYYCGRQLRQKKEDFTLPYDLWWGHVNKQLPGRDLSSQPTWNYKRIKTNVYFDIAKPISKGSDMEACQCSLATTEGQFGKCLLLKFTKKFDFFSVHFFI